MLSRKCTVRNDTIIPRLLEDHEPSKSKVENAIDLATATNWTMKHKVVNSFGAHSSDIQILSETDLEYSEDIGGNLAARAAIANLFQRHVCDGLQIDTRQVVLASGASFILDSLIEAVCDPGDLIMIATPYWSGLDISISVHNNASVLPISIPLKSFFSMESVAYYEAALGSAASPVKAALLCNPHNPLGNCYSRELLQAMIDFSTRHGIHLISDEVYALSLHSESDIPGDGFTSALSLPHDPESVHVIYSISKDFGCNGIRIGALISENEAVRMSVSLSTHSQVSSLATSFATNHILTPVMISYALKESRVALHKAYLILVSFCEEQNIEFIPANAGMFIFARLCGENERRFSKDLKTHGLLLSSGTSYHFSEPGWFRICFAVKPSILRQGLKRLKNALVSTGNNNDAHFTYTVSNKGFGKRKLAEDETDMPFSKRESIIRPTE